MTSDCGKCSWLKDAVHVEEGPPDWAQKLRPEVDDFEKIADEVHRCPECGAWFRYWHERDPHHYMGYTDITCVRLSDDQALKMLVAASYSGPHLAKLKQKLGQ